MRAKDIMTTPTISVTPETTVPAIAQLLLDRRFSAVPVIDDEGSLVGIVSEGDLLRRAEGDDSRHSSWWLRLVSAADTIAEDYVKAHGRSAANVMTREVITVTEDMPVGDIAHLLETKRIKRVPVVREGKVVGITSRADLLRGLASRRDTLPATTLPADEIIRTRVLDEIKRANLAPSYGLSVLVSDGIVQIWGIVDSSKQSEALRVAAENVSGVQSVELNLKDIPAYGWAI